MPLETAIDQWNDGQRRLDAAPADAKPVLERVTRRVEAELRRRLGGPFTTEELVDLYDQGTGWVTDVAYDAAPEHPDAWDVRVVGDAAFARYLREASDFAGGKVRIDDPNRGRLPSQDY